MFQGFGHVFMYTTEEHQSGKSHQDYTGQAMADQRRCSVQLVRTVTSKASSSHATDVHVSFLPKSQVPAFVNAVGDVVVILRPFAVAPLGFTRVHNYPTPHDPRSNTSPHSSWIGVCRGEPTGSFGVLTCGLGHRMAQESPGPDVHPQGEYFPVPNDGVDAARCTWACQGP